MSPTMQDPTQKYRLILPDIQAHVPTFPDEVLRTMLEQMSAFAAEHHGFDEIRVYLKEQYEERVAVQNARHSKKNKEAQYTSGHPPADMPSGGVMSGHVPRRHFSYGNNRKLYEDMKVNTSEEEVMKKIVIKNFKNVKDESPNVIDIDNETGEVRQISEDHDAQSLKNMA